MWTCSPWWCGCFWWSWKGIFHATPSQVPEQTAVFKRSTAMTMPNCTNLNHYKKLILAFGKMSDNFLLEKYLTVSLLRGKDILV